MHIPDGLFVHGTIVHATTAALSAAAAGVALWRARKALDDRQVPLLGVCSAFLFAAQMLNFPIGVGVSGHFLGALLAAVLLGPWNAFLVMAVILILQCLLFADGGLTALGSNLFNMGFVGAVGAYLLFRLLHALLPRTRWAFLASAAVAAWASVVAAAAACAVELAVSDTVPLALGLPAMAGVHALIGVGEAFITSAALSLILAGRPDLLSAWCAPPALKGANA